jgi:hypothetical protein
LPTAAVVAWVQELGVVESVEEFGAEFDLICVSPKFVFLVREMIPIVDARAAYRVPAQIAKTEEWDAERIACCQRR